MNKPLVLRRRGGGGRGRRLRGGARARPTPHSGARRRPTVPVDRPDHPGDVAQLAEHRLCKAGVRGSIPLVSTVRLTLEKRQPVTESSPGESAPAEHPHYHVVCLEREPYHGHITGIGLGGSGGVEARLSTADVRGLDRPGIRLPPAQPADRRHRPRRQAPLSGPPAGTAVLVPGRRWKRRSVRIGTARSITSPRTPRPRSARRDGRNGAGRRTSGRITREVARVSAARRPPAG